MKFIDEVVISVTAGRGGDGSASFRREKFIPFGGPDGGDGGHGGSIYLIGDKQDNTLSKYVYQKVFKAESGDIGRGNQRSGKQGKDLYLPIPLGCLIYDDETGELIGEVLEPKQSLLVAHRGAKGLGNTHFKSSTNRAPRQFTKGKLGESRKLKIELRVIADVGIVGLPNAGKSSLVSSVSRANLKIASYPFTTINPHLAKVYVDEVDNFIIADIPGIIEGASQGMGLGLKFLRHISRNKVLIHLVDISPVEKSNVIKNIFLILDEMINFSTELIEKKQILVFNKIDLVDEQEYQDFKNQFFNQLVERYQGTDSLKRLTNSIDESLFFISAKQNKGLVELMDYIYRNYLVDNIEKTAKKKKMN